MGGRQGARRSDKADLAGKFKLDSMRITIGGVIMLAAMLVVWVFAAVVANEPGCLSIENSESMSGVSKVFAQFFLLCWLP